MFNSDLNSKASMYFSKFVVVVPNAPTTIGITTTFSFAIIWQFRLLTSCILNLFSFFITYSVFPGIITYYQLMTFKIIPMNGHLLQLQRGGTLIYTDNKLRYKTQNDLKLYKEREIESTFLKSLNLIIRKTTLLVHIKTSKCN